ncbi:hypothetical protein AMJ49_01695 [Parcubacteria bacterium DG_74_2]|nr:MAG: hypothetical protein AMJ49_01695 [Parcubacteria bacterium DG_74_2]
MNSRELREKFLKFFEKRNHKIVPSSPLLPTDPSVLFTTAGMQQFKEYFLGKKPPFGKKICSCQKCLRTSDIEKVGNEKSLTFFEMLGSFSFGDYFKKETINFAIDFLFKELKIPLKDAFFTVFEGDKKTPFDKESLEILKGFKIPKEKIKPGKREDNFWGPTGKEGPCGPTVEIHVKNIEIWNLVFNEYYQDENGNLKPLKQKGVDTGMGLERLNMVFNNKNSVFKTDLFFPIISEIKKLIGEKEVSSFEKLFAPSIAMEKTFEDLKYQRYFRIITDHTKASVFLISEGVLPSNIERGYILRRLMRRAIRCGKLLNLPKNFLIPVAKKVIEIYSNTYPKLKRKEADILTSIQNEGERFEKTLEIGLREFEKLIKVKKDKIISGSEAFDLYQSYGFPLELVEEIASERGFEVNREEFFEAQRLHKEISRKGVEKKFGGVGKEATYEATNLHTATHLLHTALRKILGEHVKQAGSDITPQRLRFDFSHPQKITQDEIKKVEDLVNQKIKENLEVKKEEMAYQQAIKSGALAFFKEKYPERVTVYTIGDFSKEICAGPHVKETSELGHFKILKEEGAGAGIRRIRAILE